MGPLRHVNQNPTLFSDNKYYILRTAAKSTPPTRQAARIAAVATSFNPSGLNLKIRKPSIPAYAYAKT